MDLAAVPRSTESPLPTVVTASTIQLVYGIKEDRLLISTASDWNFEGTTVAESDLYQKLNQKLEGVSEGLVLVDAKGVADFVGTLRALREQLSLEVSEEALSLEDFLQGFLGAMAMSETKAYESHFGGFLMLAD